MFTSTYSVCAEPKRQKPTITISVKMEDKHFMRNSLPCRLGRGIERLHATTRAGVAIEGLRRAGLVYLVAGLKGTRRLSTSTTLPGNCAAAGVVRGTAP